MAQNPFEILLDQVRQVVREEVERVVKPALKNVAEAEPPPSPVPHQVRKWYRAAELAKMYDLPQSFFEEKGREGQIARTKPGRYVLFLHEDVERFLQSRQSGGGANGDRCQRS